MSANHSRPRPDPAESAAHGAERDTRQPYAAEHEDYHDGVATPPEEEGGEAPAEKKPVGRTRVNSRPEKR